jgi:predicted ATPase/class 3 adenylate cyclase
VTSLPTGTVTFLFTDIEGSTRLLQELGDRYEAVETEHARILRQAISQGGGTEIRTEGDSFFAVFTSPSGALRSAVTVQRALSSRPWPNGLVLRVRMGMHTGEGKTGGSGSAADYVGIDVNRAARIAAAAHGGQVLLSDATRGLVDQSLPDGVTVRDLGEHRLKDIEHPQRLYDLVIDGLPADFPPIRTLDVPTNLPAERTSFIGREREVEDVTGLLDEARLVTLTGPGGTGKTRLALRVASARVGRHRDGVFLVDLSALTEPGLVPSAIATALRVREESGRALLDTLTDYLRDRELLFLLDNFEQVAYAGPDIARLLDAAPALTVLVTSRVPLRLSGEREYHVSPLALPDRGQDLEALSRCESVVLFAERAGAIRPSFTLTEENADTVAEIAERLDGLPLAIELAASRLKVLDPASMLARLEQRLPLLTGGARDLPERQRTLRAAIEWSHDLLGPGEQRLFARLAAFSGGWTLEAAEAVCGPGPELEALDGLEALVDASLLRRRESHEDGVRFRMLETIREFAAERLGASDDEDEIRRRHAQFFRDLAEEAEPHLTREQQLLWLARLEREHDNIRAALDWATDSGEAEMALRTAAAVWRFWQQRAHLAEGRSRLERIVALPGPRDASRARGLGALGSIAYWQGDYDVTEAVYREALAIARELGDPLLIARALFDFSFTAMVRGDYDQHQQLLRESLAHAEGIDPALTAHIWGSFGFLEVFRGNDGAAIDPLRRASALHRQRGELFFLAEDLSGLGIMEVFTGDLPAAREHLREAVAIQADKTSPMSLPGTLLGLAIADVREQRHRRAARLMGAAARLRNDLGGGPPTELMITGREDPERAARRALGDEEYDRARAEGYAMSLKEAVAFALEGSAEDSAIPDPGW